MAVRTEQRQKRRTPLTRERVMRAAVRLADKGGVDAVSMRKIGQALRVEAMSLYRHVTDKDDILDGMVDLVFSEIELPGDGSRWKEAMRRRAGSARQVLRRHPWAIGLMDSRSNAGPSTIRHHDAVIGSLRRGGFSIEMAAHAFSLLDSYIYGFTLQELSLPFKTPEELTEMAAALLPEPTEDLPYFSEMVTAYALNPGYSYADEFEFGLDLILDAIERAAGATPQP